MVEDTTNPKHLQTVWIWKREECQYFSHQEIKNINNTIYIFFTGNLIVLKIVIRLKQSKFFKSSYHLIKQLFWSFRSKCSGFYQNPAFCGTNNNNLTIIFHFH